jgi:hypothetical protein
MSKHPPLAAQIKHVLDNVEAARDAAGTGDKGRRLATAATHLRTALDIVRSATAEEALGDLPLAAKGLPAVRELLKKLAL